MENEINHNICTKYKNLLNVISSQLKINYHPLKNISNLFKKSLLKSFPLDNLKDLDRDELIENIKTFTNIFKETVILFFNLAINEKFESLIIYKHFYEFIISFIIKEEIFNLIYEVQKYSDKPFKNKLCKNYSKFKHYSLDNFAYYDQNSLLNYFIKYKKQILFVPAIKLLKRMKYQKSPMKILMQIVKMNNAIFKCIFDYFLELGLDFNQENINKEVLITINCYVICQSNEDNIFTFYKLIENFVSENNSLTYYYFTIFKQSLFKFLEFNNVIFN